MGRRQSASDGRPGDDGGRPGHHDGLQPPGHRLREVPENGPVPGGLQSGQRVRLPPTFLSSQRDGSLISPCRPQPYISIKVPSLLSFQILTNIWSISCYFDFPYSKKALQVILVKRSVFHI